MKRATTHLPNDCAQRGGRHRALRIIEGLDAAIASEFARVTRIVIGDHAEPGAGASRLLNKTGAPLELSFNLSSQDLRYTMEVGRQETTPAGHLKRIELLLPELGVDPDWGGVARTFSTLQPEPHLAWGGWLGARQSYQNTHAGSTRYKIYAEVPCLSNAATEFLLERYLGFEPTLTGLRAVLVMVGAAPASERCEFYFQLDSRTLPLACLRELLRRVDLAHKLPDLTAAIGSFEFRHGNVPEALPKAQYGLSYSVLPGGREPVFSLFVFAEDLAGGDAWVRRQVLAVARQRGINLRTYETITEPMAGLYFQSLYHNMLTFSVDAESLSPYGLQISVCPPPDTIIAE